MRPLLGAIADDHTGATDLATTLVSRGYRTRLSLGLPDDTTVFSGELDAVVIGLKTRSVPAAEAVQESLQALRLLRSLGCERIYDKYCATFDSTPEGNIGPILDALMDELGIDRTVIVLPFPEAGRTVYQGHLFVDGTLLDQSSMRNHPITPMKDSRIAHLLRPQTDRSISEVCYPDVAEGAQRVSDLLNEISEGITIVDAITRTDLDAVATATRDFKLLSGGAGLAASFPHLGNTAGSIRTASGYRAVLAGSASAETQHQIALARPHLPHKKLSTTALRDSFDDQIEGLVEWARECWSEDPHRPVLVYSVGSPDDIVDHDEPGQESTSVLVERSLAQCAQSFASNGMGQLIVAGGETSGSVTSALGIRTFDVGAPLSPGIAWAYASDHDMHNLNILLKSGSLGEPNLFTAAWEQLPGPRTPDGDDGKSPRSRCDSAPD